MRFKFPFWAGWTTGSVHGTEPWESMGKWGKWWPMGKWWWTMNYRKNDWKMMNKWWVKVHVSLGKMMMNYGIWPKYQGFNHQEWGFNRWTMDMGLTKNGRYPQKNAVFSWWKLPTIGLQGYPMFRPITRILSIHAETEWWGMVSDNFGGPWSAQSQNQFDTGYQGFGEITCSIDEMSVLFGWFDPTKIDLFVESMKLGQFEASDFRIYQHELGTWKTSRWHR